MSEHDIICLLPARNAAADLPAYLESAVGFCDGIVALDDGSTDETEQILAGHPLVKILLHEPRRETYAGWDDGRNRNRLLEAAEALDPRWIICVDADERLDASDAAALRCFLSQDARPRCAYQLQVFRMVGDLEHYDPHYLWACRLHWFEPGQRISERGLHMVPVPSSIPRRAWLRTTLRIQHVGSITRERRRARYAKYREADPDRRYQASYAALLSDPPMDAPRWQPRPPDLPVLLGNIGHPGSIRPDAGRVEQPPVRLEVAALSVIVIAHNDEAVIERAVQAVINQQCPEPFEVIVVTSGTDRTAEIVAARFPQVQLISLAGTALPGKARNAGLERARGEFVTFPGSHVELSPGSLAARLQAHRDGFDLVSGSVINGTKTWAGWASYFIDHYERLPGRKREVLAAGFVPHGCSYRRDILLKRGGFPEDMRAGEDTTVNFALVSRGFSALHDPAVRYTHYTPCRTSRRLLVHHFTRGRGGGRLYAAKHIPDGASAAHRVTCLRGSLKKSIRTQLGLLGGRVFRDGPELSLIYVWAFPLVVLGLLANRSGIWYEVLRRRDGA
jgi:glycosyltransferase involved in cell wall biosynthesis